jgi:prepilin-type processing-associated H-X9-DG protein
MIGMTAYWADSNGYFQARYGGLYGTVSGLWGPNGATGTNYAPIGPGLLYSMEYVSSLEGQFCPARNQTGGQWDSTLAFALANWGKSNNWFCGDYAYDILMLKRGYVDRYNNPGTAHPDQYRPEMHGPQFPLLADVFIGQDNGSYKVADNSAHRYLYSINIAYVDGSVSNMRLKDLSTSRYQWGNLYANWGTQGTYSMWKYSQDHYGN